MNDSEFLQYCETHSHTERCGFVPSQIARLCKLIGDEDSAKNWAALDNGVYDMDGIEIRAAVATARANIMANPQKETTP